jgi:hypothetical protein
MVSKNFKTVLLGALILILIAPTYLSFVSSASGNIKVNSKTASTPTPDVSLGGNVNLYFGNVIWTGQYTNLFMSLDGLSSISSGDVLYSPSFNVYDITNTTVKSYSNGNVSNAWIVGYNWVNGSISSTVPVGNYYIKAFDQVSSTVAVTDTYLKVFSAVSNSTLIVSPSAGPGGVPIQFTGNGYPPSSTVTISYYDPTFNSWNPLMSTTANASGWIKVNSEVPDLKKSVGINSDYPENYNSISYRSQIGGVIYGTVNYEEWARGLKTVGNQTADGLFGNGTSLVSSVKVIVGDNITISGKWFHPGVIYIRWDGVNVVGTVTNDEWLNANIIGTSITNSNGSFTTSVKIPSCNAGEHFIAVEDSQTRLIVKIFVSTATLQISPSSGPGGVNAQLTGSGYTPNAPVLIFYYDPFFDSWNYWSQTTADNSGNMAYNFEVPDLKHALTAGNSSLSYTTLSFKTEVYGAPCAYVDYDQYYRGLSRVGNAYGLYGNGTDLSYDVVANVGSNLVISGNWFHPGVVYVRFDGQSVVGTVTADEWANAQVIGTSTASSAGSFQTTVTIPNAYEGVHYLAIEDSQTIMITQIYVSSSTPNPSSTPTPTSAPTAAPTSNPSPNPTPAPTPTPTPTPNPVLLTPTIDLAGKGTATTTSFNVEINGKVLLGENPLPDASVLLSYSKSGGLDWDSLTMVKTGSDGSFTALWHPDATGNYMLKATIDPSSTYNGASKTVNLALAPDSGHYLFSVTSNSTITQFAFNSTSNQLSFTASGPSNTKGYITLYIPKSLLSNITDLKAYVDGNQVQFSSQSQDDSWLISLTYSHSQHAITLQIGDGKTTQPIGESLPLGLIIAIPVVAIVAVVVAVIAFKKRQSS